MTGHVFIIRGDITKVSCDAWLLPGGMPGRPGPTWKGAVRADPAEPVPSAFGTPGHRVVEWHPLDPTDPIPYMTDVGGSWGTPIRWYLDAVVEFFDRVSADLDDMTPRNDRERPLVAVPLVGTGQGGKRREAGAVARDLLPVLYEQAARTHLDIVLVMFEGAAYSAAQAERTTQFEATAFAALGNKLLEAARRLSNRAAKGELVLFIGAGVSMAAGLPSWGGLLAELARQRCHFGAEEHRDFLKLSVLDQARVIESRLPDDDLGAVVAELLRAKSRHHSLSHALLAGLPVDEAVTMSYDELFERASVAAGRPLAVLPYEPVQEGGRWLLKMHGCVSHPEDIVLTRDHYLEYKNRREALAGIVQALLITRHMLFVGFSHEDDNFHQIIRAVKKALRRETPDKRPFGTSLVVDGNPIAEGLWKNDLRMLSMDGGGASRAQAARRFEIMLDRIAAGAPGTTAHLFDPRYGDVLNPAELRLRNLLTDLTAAADGDIRATPAWAEIEEALARLGHKCG